VGYTQSAIAYHFFQKQKDIYGVSILKKNKTYITKCLIAYPICITDSCLSPNCVHTANLSPLGLIFTTAPHT